MGAACYGQVSYTMAGTPGRKWALAPGVCILGKALDKGGTTRTRDSGAEDEQKRGKEQSV